MQFGIALRRASALAAYIGSIIGANVLADRFGMVWVFPGLTAVAGTYLAGAALLFRDVLQDVAGRFAVLAAVAVGGALSAVMSDPALALASSVAFLVAESADFGVYTPLRRRGWARAVIVSNSVGALLDTIIFLALAEFPVTESAITGQMIGKLIWATLLPVMAVSVFRALRKRRVKASGEMS